MHIVLLSGGSGKRLWPLSNDIRSKQFIKIFRTDTGEYQSMVQRVYGQIRAAMPDAEITIATSKSQVSSIINQVGNQVGISVEPCRRDTFPAIMLAAAYLVDVKRVSPLETVVICPVDPYVEQDYFFAIKRLAKQAATGEANLVLMGIEPTYPSEKYGYIMPADTSTVSSVRAFKEKPTEAAAREYIRQGALWNGGIFAFQLKYLLQRGHELIDFADYNDLYNKYSQLPKISFDYAVVEKEPHIQVMRFKGQWKDLGTWNTLSEAMPEQAIGEAALEEATCKNVHVVNELGIPVLALGLHDVIISASPEGILVADKERSSHIKPLVENISSGIRFAEKSWGSYRVLDADDHSMTIKVTLNPGKSMNYHNHHHRDEVWVVVSGHGRTFIEGKLQNVKAGDIIAMPMGVRHTVFADTELKLIEVQLGEDISVKDKEKHLIQSMGKCFGGADIRGIYPVQVNEGFAYRIGRYFPRIIKHRGMENLKIAVGCDVRLSSPALQRELMHGLQEAGCSVVDIGQCGTEMMYFAVAHLGLAGGIMATASHNSGEYNGFKLVGAEAKPISSNSGLKELEKLCQDEPNRIAASDSISQGSAEQYDIMPLYIKHLCSYVDISLLRPMRIVVNASNGSAGAVVDELEKILPFEFIRINCEPDGNFPNGVPNPMLNENREATAQAVRKFHADLGVAWDGDFDRCFLFDEEGMMIEGYYLVGLLAEAFLSKAAGQRIIHDARVYWNTQAICEKYGGEAVLCRAGHSFIKEKMRQANAVYGGEMSSHHYFRDFFYCDSGMIPWLLVTELLARKNIQASSLVNQAMAHFPCSGEINTQVESAADAERLMQEIENAYASVGEVSHEDGLSVDCGSWRFNLRRSNTEPVLRLNVESRGNRKLLAARTEELLAAIRK